MNRLPELPQNGFVTALWLKRYLSISNSTLYLWIADKRLPAPVKIGARAVRFRVEDIRAFEARLLAQAAGVER